MKIIKQDNNENVFPYIAYIPENISDRPALIIQLHGVGERGDGGEDIDRVQAHGFPNIVNDDNLKDAVLIMPQCPSNTFWVARIESIKKFIDMMIEKYSIDTDRVYICGLSMGGYGTWYTAMAFPEMFAAIAPCCGGGMAWYAGVLHMPIWAFHGLEDGVVSANQTIEMVERLKTFNKNLRYDLYEGVGHNAWVKAFSEETLNWLLSHKKDK